MKHRLVYLAFVSIVLVVGYVQQMASALWLEPTTAGPMESRHLLADATTLQDDALPAQRSLERGRSLAEGGPVRRQGSTFISLLDASYRPVEWKPLCHMKQAADHLQPLQPAIQLRLCLWLI